MAYNPTYPVLEVTEEATDQEIFDAVVRHLAMQGKRASGVNGCVYRTTDGLACAVGCLLEDDRARLIDECEFGTAIHSAIRRGIAPRWASGHIHLLLSLQEAHDGHMDTPDIAGSLADVATAHSLSPAIITEFATELSRWEA